MFICIVRVIYQSLDVNVIFQEKRKTVLLSIVYAQYEFLKKALTTEEDAPKFRVLS